MGFGCKINSLVRNWQLLTYRRQRFFNSNLRENKTKNINRKTLQAKDKGIYFTIHWFCSPSGCQREAWSSWPPLPRVCDHASYLPPPSWKMLQTPTWQLSQQFECVLWMNGICGVGWGSISAIQICEEGGLVFFPVNHVNPRESWPLEGWSPQFRER